MCYLNQCFFSIIDSFVNILNEIFLFSIFTFLKIFLYSLYSNFYLFSFTLVT